MIGSCKVKETNQSTVVASEPMAMQPAIGRQNGRGVWLYRGKNSFSHTYVDISTQYSFSYLRKPRLL